MDDKPYNDINCGANELRALAEGLDRMLDSPGVGDVCRSVIYSALGKIDEGLEDMKKELEAAEKEEKTA